MTRINPISCVLFFVLAGSVIAQKTYTVSTAEELQFLFANPAEGVIVNLKPGEYHLTPSQMVDNTCGNCEDPNTSVPITVGLYITGWQVQILGPADHSAVIVTRAGYGLFFDHCKDGLVRNLTITGGVRDADGNANDAAIVVKNSDVIIDNNIIRDNIGDSASVMSHVVGIMGICGREGAKLSILSNRIVRNSWDGIALYRGADADIKFNTIDGVDKAAGSQVGGGRGVGIGVTWDAKARIEYNLVRNYWKGIGLFVDANGVVRYNVIEDLLTWGIALWDADKGKPVGVIQYNVIYNTGACGASVTSSTQENPGDFVGNVMVKTAQDVRYDSSLVYCYQCALAKHSVPNGFRIAENTFFSNRRGSQDLPDYDVPEAEFRQAIVPVCRELVRYRFFRDSDFVKDFCGDY